jgi:hypothetical protein
VADDQVRPRPIYIALGDKKCLLHGDYDKDDSVYTISFTPSPEPLQTKEQVDAFQPDPVVVIEFLNRDGMEVLRDMIDSMLKHQKQPTWHIVYKKQGERDE